MRARLRPLLVLLAGVIVLAMIALWAFLAAWIPHEGRALLIREVEGRYPVTLSIGAMRYEPFRGFFLGDVQLDGREAGDTWVRIPAMRVRMDWVPLLARRLSLHSQALLAIPCETDLRVSAAYDLKSGRLALKLDTTEILLSSVTAPLRQHLPPALSGGSVQVRARMRREAPAPPIVEAAVTGTGLTWSAEPWRATGDAVLTATLSAPTMAGQRWDVRGSLAVRGGGLEGVPGVGAISRIDGTARFGAGEVQIDELTGFLWGSLWTVQGRILLASPPTFELASQAHVQLSPLADHFAARLGGWQPGGLADLDMICRGIMTAPVFSDCQGRADFREASLAGPKLIAPLSDLRGRAAYDALTRELALHDISATLQDHALRAEGTVRLEAPSRWALRLEGSLPLEALLPWLPAGHPFVSLGGVAQGAVDVTGSAEARSQYTGEIRLREGQASFAAAALAVEDTSAVIRLDGARIDISEAALRLNGVPLTLTATVLTDRRPEVSSTVQFPDGTLELRARIDPRAILIDEGRLSISATHAELTGTLGRGRPSALRLTGLVELAELSRVPFLPTAGLAAWKPEGRVQVDAHVQGDLARWPLAELQARLQADRLRLRDVPLEGVLCTIEQRDRLMRVSVPAAQLAGGKLWGQLSLRHGDPARDFLLEADLVGLDLARLAELIPAWRSRSITGTASSRVMCSGTYGMPLTWRGEGWLNASGERLGDVPLLDRVFRGLFGVLGDRLGLESLRRAHITRASLTWKLAQERFMTEDLRLAGLAGTEPVAVYAKGSVGLDQTLDFVMEPEFSEGVMLQSPMTSSLAGTLLKAAGQLERLRRLIGRHRLVGTLKEPEYRFELTTQEIFGELGPAPGDFLGGLLDAVR